MSQKVGEFCVVVHADNGREFTHGSIGVSLA
jgi:hypothetical protein